MMESDKLISNLQSQIRDLKTRLATRDDLTNNELHTIAQSRTLELDDMRKENTMMAKRY